MAKLTIAAESCKGCGLCADVCPRHILALSKDINAKGYHPAQCIAPEQCVGCAACATMCPDVAITVER